MNEKMGLRRSVPTYANARKKKCASVKSLPSACARRICPSEISFTFSRGLTSRGLQIALRRFHVPCPNRCCTVRKSTSPTDAPPECRTELVKKPVLGLITTFAPVAVLAVQLRIERREGKAVSKPKS